MVLDNNTFFGIPSFHFSGLLHNTDALRVQRQVGRLCILCGKLNSHITLPRRTEAITGDVHSEPCPSQQMRTPRRFPFLSAPK